ncbi:MAG: Serine-protein kinase RsbW [bacterium]|nr:Serine-protein kinase RsbW [bacterium]
MASLNSAELKLKEEAMLPYRFQTLAVEANHLATEIFESMPRRNSKASAGLAKAEQVYELTTPSHTENLELIRNFVSQIAQKIGLNEMAVMEIEMAVEEASVNAIKHAHQNNAAKPLRLQIKIDKHKLTALVKDQGQGFDPQKLDGQNAQVALFKRQNGGRGILMMKMLMDEVQFDGGNGKGMQVRLVKYLTPPPQKNIH